MQSKSNRTRSNRDSGKARTGILLWLLGVPLPIILLIFVQGLLLNAAQPTTAAADRR